MLIISSLRRLRLEDPEFGASLDYMRPHVSNKIKQGRRDISGLCFVALAEDPFGP